MTTGGSVSVLAVERNVGLASLLLPVLVSSGMGTAMMGGAWAWAWACVSPGFVIALVVVRTLLLGWRCHILVILRRPPFDTVQQRGIAVHNAVVVRRFRLLLLPGTLDAEVTA